MAFDYDLDFDNIDFHEQLELCRGGRGEQGVLLVESYKITILQLWCFKTHDIAKEPSDKIYQIVFGL